MGSQPTPMHYLFLDESYSVESSSTSVTIGVWTVEQTTFDAYVSQSRELYRTPILDSINLMLEKLNGLAVVASGTFDSTTYRTRERDTTDDIGGMARPDNIWSQCVIYTTAMLIRELIRREIDVDSVDIYHDPKTLKADHADALAQTLRTLVASLATQFTTERGIPLMKNLDIRHIKAVAKTANGPGALLSKLAGIEVAG